MTYSKPFVCRKPNCNKEYTTRFSLRRHLVTHMKERKFGCTKCPRRFALAQYLKEHSLIHEQQKPFVCDFPGCNISFRQAGKLSLHRKTYCHSIFIITKVDKREQESESTKFQLLSERITNNHDLRTKRSEELIKCQANSTIDFD